MNSLLLFHAIHNAAFCLCTLPHPRRVDLPCSDEQRQALTTLPGCTRIWAHAEQVPTPRQALAYKIYPLQRGFENEQIASTRWRQ